MQSRSLGLHSDGQSGRIQDSASTPELLHGGLTFADDFRLCVLGIEAEFWPHSGIDRPTATVTDWWQAALDTLTRTPEEISA